MLSLFGGRGELHDLTKARQTSALTRALTRANGNPNSLDVAGRTALHVAVDQGYGAEASLLLQHGANASAADKVQKSLLPANATHPHIAQTGATPLHLAVMRQDAAMVELLLQHGANVSLSDKVRDTCNTHTTTRHPCCSAWMAAAAACSHVCAAHEWPSNCRALAAAHINAQSGRLHWGHIAAHCCCQKRPGSVHVVATGWSKPKCHRQGTQPLDVGACTANVGHRRVRHRCMPVAACRATTQTL